METLDKVIRLIELLNAFRSHPFLKDRMVLKGGTAPNLFVFDLPWDTLTGALRRKKDRIGDLLRAIRYERIQVYEDLGQHRRARSELEKLYAEAPDYENVAPRLGL
ncbi:MAG: hypothetical protein ACE5FQ_13775 [Thiogranum sp.]